MTALNPTMRIGRQVNEAMRVHGVPPGDRVLDLLAQVDLPDPPRIAHSYPHHLSGGQRQRVMIAMALALEPALLIADEPTTALDVTTQMGILRLIRDLQRRRGTGVLFITHDFGVVAEIADRVAVMQHGKVVEQGPAADVLDRPQHPYTRALIAAVPHRTPTPRKAAEGPVVLQVAGLDKTYRRRGWFGGRQVHAIADAAFPAPAGRDAGPGGGERIGQEHAGPLHGAAGAARRRDHRVRWRRPAAALAHGVEAVSQAHPDGVPGPVRLAEPQEAGGRPGGGRAGGARHAARAGPGAGGGAVGAGAAGPLRGGALPARVQRRPAPAHRPGPGAGHGAGAAGCGRARSARWTCPSRRRCWPCCRSSGSG